MNEAKGSWNGYYRTAEGNKDQFTLRQADAENDLAFITRIKSFQQALKENGWRPWLHESAPAPHTEKTAAQADPETREGKSFDVETIKLAAGGENPRWVVKGGNFKKFGVTCWPETLDTAGIASKLDPLKDNKPTGDWVAHYVERQNDEGKWVPDKVTKLERRK
jgi:hypothetical protein